MKRLFAGVALLGVVFGPNHGDAQPSAHVVGQGVAAAALAADNARARVIVFFEDGGLPFSESAARSRAIAERREAVLDQIPSEEFRVTDTYENLSAVGGYVTFAGLRKLVRDYRVLRIDLDMEGHMALAESTDLVHARDVHAAGITGRGSIVAVLDTGIDSDHPDLADDLVEQQCFCTNADGSGCCPGGRTEASGPGAGEDEQGHGTHVAGIITGGGRVAPRGMAPDADIISVRVLDKTGAAASANQLLKAFDWIIGTQRSVRIVNTSLVFGSFPGQCDGSNAFTAALAQAVNILRSRGTLTVSSAGNAGNKAETGAPACLSGAIGVGAVYDGNVGTVSFGCTDASTAADKIACFSNSSSAVDLLAPGAAISSSGMGGGVAGFAGTSQAAPHVAGAIALMLQAKPSATADEIEAALKASGRPLTDSNGVRASRIEVRSAINAIK